MIRFGTIAVFMLLALMASSLRAADGDWEFGVRGGGMITDNAFRLDGSAEYATITRRLGDRRAVELEFGADQLDFSMDFGLRHKTLAVNYVEVNREPLWDPYVLIGLGVSEFDAPTGVTRGHDAMVQFATGGSWELSDNGKVLLRGDVRMRYDLNDTGQPGQDGWGDAIFTVGLSYRF